MLYPTDSKYKHDEVRRDDRPGIHPLKICVYQLFGKNTKEFETASIEDKALSLKKLRKAFLPNKCAWQPLNNQEQQLEQ